MGFMAEEKVEDEMFVLTTCKNDTLECDSMLFIDSKVKEAEFSVTIRKGKTNICQFRKLTKESKFKMLSIIKLNYQKKATFHCFI